jgi:hypothetical protein
MAWAHWNGELHAVDSVEDLSLFSCVAEFFTDCVCASGRPSGCPPPASSTTATVAAPTRTATTARPKRLSPGQVDCSQIACVLVTGDFSVCFINQHHITDLKFCVVTFHLQFCGRVLLSGAGLLLLATEE